MGALRTGSEFFAQSKPFEGMPASLGPGLRTASGANGGAADFAAACRSVSMPENSTKSQKTKLAASIAKGLSVAKWANDNQVPARTAYRWSVDPEVRARVERSRRRALDRAIGHMSHRVNWAAKGITTLAKTAVSEPVKLAAFKTIISNMMAVSEFAELKDRMAELEELLHERERAGDTGQAG
jgi:hypothetical protein